MKRIKTHEQAKWFHKMKIFQARKGKWIDDDIDNDTMWKSIKNACKNNPIENVDENMSIEEAIEHVREQLQILYRNAR